MNPSYGIIVWIVIGALAGAVVHRFGGGHRREPAVRAVVAGVIGAIGAGAGAELALRGVATSSVVAPFAALAGALLALALVRVVQRRNGRPRRRSRVVT